ncbi:MAG: CPBP family intramembrane metalloprotease [bacterium]|nr:CPBP family intramembrane metalloprotease [bacterium]
MNEEMSKGKKHLILGHPVLFGIVLICLGTLACDFLATLIVKNVNAMLALNLPLEDKNAWRDFSSAVIRILFSCFLVFCMKKSYGKNFSMGFTNERFKKSMLIGMPILFMALSNIPEYLLKGGTVKSGWMLALGILAGFAPGFYEEIVVRGTILSNMMIQWKDKKNVIYNSMIISSVIFGLVHLMNLSHSSIPETLYQVAYACGIGFIFAAVYLRTRNIVAPIAYHALVDILADIFALPANAPDTILFSDIVAVIITVGGTILGFYLVRKEKHQEIKELWNLNI